jgi:hypothetical protein
MSVVGSIIETQTDKEKEMENSRYEFGGFTFGSSGQTQLTIRTLKENRIGYTMEVAFELTLEEKAELIKFLLTVADKDKN